MLLKHKLLNVCLDPITCNCERWQVILPKFVTFFLERICMFSIKNELSTGIT